mgnify:CR=1 FL=1
MSNPATSSSRPAGGPVAERASGWLTLLNYLLPGAGFCLAGRRARGLLQAGMVLVTMALGFSLHGGVAWPSWSPQAQDFNLINNFTFIVQMGGGLPALASLAANLGGWSLLAGVPQDAYYELGGYYLVVAGAVNYFAALNFHDRLVKQDSRFREQEMDDAEGLL